MTTVTDDFTGTGALSANWVGPGYARSSDVCISISGAQPAYWATNTFTGDQTAQIVVGSVSSGGWGSGPMVKYTVGGNDGYFISFSTTRLFVERGVGTGLLVFDTSSSITVTAGDVLKITAVASGGNLLVSAFQNGTLLGSYTDTSPFVGTRIGICSHSYDVAWSGDNFSGGDLSSGTAPAITTQPTSQTVTAGATATFGPIAFTGTGSPTVQWYESTDGGSTYTAISGATSTSYAKTGTTTGMSGYKYKAVVHGDTAPDATTSIVTLTVTGASAVGTVRAYYENLKGSRNV